MSETEVLKQDVQGSASMVAIAKQSGTVTLLGSAGVLAAGRATNLLSEAADKVDPELKIALAGLKQVADQAAADHAADQAAETKTGATYNKALASVIVQVRNRLGMAVADAAGYGSYGFVHSDGSVQGFMMQPLDLSA